MLGELGEVSLREGVEETEAYSIVVGDVENPDHIGVNNFEMVPNFLELQIKEQHRLNKFDTKLLISHLHGHRKCLGVSAQIHKLVNREKYKIFLCPLFLAVGNYILFQSTLVVYDDVSFPQVIYCFYLFQMLAAELGHIVSFAFGVVVDWWLFFVYLLQLVEIEWFDCFRYSDEIFYF